MTVLCWWLVSLCIWCVESSASSGLYTVIIDARVKSDVVIPCGSLDPPYTYRSYTKTGAFIVAENSLELYKVNNVKRSHNGDEYCCYSIKFSDTHCYQLNVSYRPYVPLEKFTHLPQLPVLGEAYDFECPYESNPPADYKWSRVAACDYDPKLLSWPQFTAFLEDNKTLRLDGVSPVHNGFYMCSATNTLGSKSWCFWNRINVKYT